MEKKQCIDFLVKYCSIGQSRGCFSIKDASVLYKAILLLKKGEETQEIYETLIKGIIIANNKGCFSLEEASNIDEVVSFLQSNDLIKIKETKEN